MSSSQNHKDPSRASLDGETLAESIAPSELTVGKKSTDTFTAANDIAGSSSREPTLSTPNNNSVDPPHRKSLFDKLPWKHHRSDDAEDSAPKAQSRKESIADSGPYIFVRDPNTGKDVLQRNPHWPNQDSHKREKEVKGQWAFGDVMGQQSVDFGGTL